MTTEVTSEVNQKLDLQIARTQQAKKLAPLFAPKLGINEEEYIESLPRFEYGLKIFKNRIPLIVARTKKIPLAEMLKIADITATFDPKLIGDFNDNGPEVPNAPYATWVAIEEKNLHKSARKVRRSLAFYERGGSIYETIMLSILRPDFFDDEPLALPGSKIGSIAYRRSYAYVPVIERSNGKLILTQETTTNPVHNSLIAGRI